MVHSLGVGIHEAEGPHGGKVEESSEGFAERARAR